MSTEYERQRNKNIEANKRLLESLGLDVLCASLPRASAPVVKPRPKPQPKVKPTAVKRKAEQIEGGAEDGKTKIARLNGEHDTGRRRPSRRSAVNVDYNEDKLADNRQKYLQQQKEQAEDAAEDAAGYVGNKLGKRKHDPCVNRQLNNPSRQCLSSFPRKQFGSIEGVEVGAWWGTRYVLFDLLYL